MTDAEVAAWLETYCTISGRDPVIKKGIVESIDMVAFKPCARSLKSIPVFFKWVTGWFDCGNLAHDVVFMQYPERVGGRWLFASELQLGEALFRHFIASPTAFPLALPLTGGSAYAGLLQHMQSSTARYAQTDFKRQSLWVIQAYCKDWYNTRMAEASRPFQSSFSEQNNIKYRFIGRVNVQFSYRYKRYIIKRRIPFSPVDAFNTVERALKTYWESRDYLQLVTALQHTRYAEYLDPLKTEVAVPELDAL